jgi:peptidoglycan hydrolase-like protein with peptidoglycan-binding domain
VRVDSLKRSIAADTEQRQKSTEEHMVSLEAKLAGERSNARAQIESLKRSVAADAGQRQKSTEEHVASLQAKLEEESSRHEASTQATETFLARIQNEQQSLVKRIPELENNIQGVATRLQDSQQLESKKLQHSLLKFMIIFGALFATGTLVGAIIMQALQDRTEELAVVKQDIHDTRVFMKQHLDNQDTVLNELTLALNRQTAGDLSLVEKKSLAHEAETPEADIQPQKTVTFTPDISELQASLIVLGFDLGISKPNGELSIKTRQALQEFRQFYLPDSDAQDDVISEPLAALILKSADLARADAARFRIDSDVLAAIRLGSIRTGVDFSFLMEIARVESYFNPTVRAAKSSATGLFQFKDYAWLESIRTFGADYGLEDYATRVKLIDDEEHEQQPIVHNPLQLEVLALRLNPRLSTLMAAENIKRSLQILSASTQHAPVRTNLYLAHFLGPDAAVIFLKTLDEEPAIIARDIFPKEAELNPGVFQSRKHQPRTVAEVYRWLDNKFNIARYEEHNPG